jgi:hypothetical protein
MASHGTDLLTLLLLSLFRPTKTRARLQLTTAMGLVLLGYKTLHFSVLRVHH